MSDIRVRIAPSPSGFLHIGTAKMALFNWLFARRYNGTFILRLEDTDVERSTEEFAMAMCEGFHWLGIEWDEGPEFGDVPQKGDYGPYRQSRRKDLHVQAAQRLVDEGKAYKCFCTKDELAAMRERAAAEKRPPRYEGVCRNLSPEELESKKDMPYSIRFKIPEGDTIVDDMVQGQVRTKNKEFDDFIIVKPNGFPVFHLAVVVDDATMRISHVIRGDDHLTNAARHAMLFDALGYDRPRFAHLPLVHDEKGKKFSKREHGANVMDWRNDGYLSEALINYVVLLGWTPKEEGRELFTREELLEAFDEKRWGASAARFDRKKLDWINGQHIRRLTSDQLRDMVLPILEKEGFDIASKSPEWLTRMAGICQEKIPTLNHIVPYTDFFFVEPQEYEEKAVRKQWGREDALLKMQHIRRAVDMAEPFTHDELKKRFEQLAVEHEVGLGQFIHPARLALTGKSVGPGLFELAELLGRPTCLHRIDKAIKHIEQMQDSAV